MLNIYPVRAFNDNYIWIIHNQEYAAVIDPGDASPVFNYLSDNKLQLIAILNTHHHHDHVGGNAGLLNKYSVPVYGPENEPIPTLTHPLTEHNRVTLKELALNLNVLKIPGHTAGHIAYYDQKILFCGDTLFACGCGRIFEGTSKQMYTSLQKLANLPNDTRVYCAHEYTSANISFAQTVEPGNIELSKLAIKTRTLRNEELPTLPSTIGIEKETNPFLRCHNPEIIRSVCNYANKSLSDPVDVFTELRRWKNTF